MTTVCIDIKNRKIVADTRTTFTDSKTKKVLGRGIVKKVHRHPTGKFIGVIFGCAVCSSEILNGLGFWVENIREYNKEGNSGGVLLLNCYNNQITHICRSYKRGKVINKLNYYTGATRITAGSGKDIAAKVFDLLGDSEKAVYYSAMVDSGTNDKIMVEELPLRK